MLAKQLRGDPKLAPVLDKITQQTFRASEIVNGLLNFSRTSGTEFISIDLNQLLRDSLILLDHQFKTARIRVESDLDPTLAPIHGNQGKLQQVILNLMLNAKDAMQSAPAGDAVLRHSRTCTERDNVIVEIADSGTGIAPEHLHRIFDPFFTTKTNPANPASTKAPAWASPSPTASSRSTAARSPPPPPPTRAPPSASKSPPPPLSSAPHEPALRNSERPSF